jgi:hypothetical protein
MWKGADDRKMVVSVRVLRALRDGVLFLERWWRVTRSWDHGGVAGWLGKEKMGWKGGTLAMAGRIGVVGRCDGILVTFCVDSG